MRRTQVYLEETQDHELQRRALTAGKSKSALIRDAVNAYLNGELVDEHDALDRFRNAVKAAAGIAPYLPPGAAYVEEMRAADGARESELRRRRSR